MHKINKINISKRAKAVLAGVALIVIVFNLFHHDIGGTNEKYKQFQKLFDTAKEKYRSVDHFRIENNYTQYDMRYNLSQAFPYEKSPIPVPRSIWQTWKTNNIEEIEEGLQMLIGTWTSQENFTHTIISDQEINEFVEKNFNDSAPDVVKAFNLLPHIVLKSDLMRYMLLFTQGGVYSDIDTAVSRNLETWLTYNNTMINEFEPNQIGLIVGVEGDEDQKDWTDKKMPRRIQICQWTLQAKRGHPVYRELIARIVDLALNHYNPETKILSRDEEDYDFNHGSPSYLIGVLEWTGPAMFTDVLFDYLNEVYITTEKLNPLVNFSQNKIVDPNRRLRLQKKIKYAKLQSSHHHDYNPIHYPFGWQNVTKIEHPILFDDDVLILPRSSFYYTDDKSHENYVHHFFKGSWKNH